MSRRTLLSLVFMATLVLPAPAASGLVAAQTASPLIISDDDFRAVDWQVAIAEDSHGGSHETSQAADGGNSGPYRHMIHTLPQPAAGQPAWLEVEHHLMNQSYSPVLQGAITRLDVEFDSALMALPPCGDCAGAANVNTWLVLTQAGRVFRSVLNTNTSWFDPAWKTHSLSYLEASHFEATDGTQDNPDFSSTGGPIYFGYARRTSRGAWIGLPAGEALVLEHGVDNFRVTVFHDAPAPRPQLELYNPGHRTLEIRYANVGTAAAPSVVIEVETGPHLLVYPDHFFSTPGWLCAPRNAYMLRCLIELGDLAPGQSGSVSLFHDTAEIEPVNIQYLTYAAAWIYSLPEPRPTAIQWYEQFENGCGNGTCIQGYNCVLYYLARVTGQPVLALASALANGLPPIVTFYQVREDVLRLTQGGRHYIGLYETYSPDIIAALEADSALLAEGVALLASWGDPLHMLVTGRGDQVIITDTMVAGIETFLDHLSAVGGPGLQQVIAAERARTPLSQFVGMTMADARAELIGYPTLYLPLVAAP